MDPETTQTERVLAVLGKAHRDGAFSGDAARYPWRTAGPEASSFTHRRFAWARVGVPVAAAAAVAVLFVGPSLWNPRGVHEVAQNTLGTGAVEKPDQPAVTEAVPTTAETVTCDYNGDGLVDGKDIQAFMNRLRDAGGGTIREADYLQRCLLGN